MEGVRRSSYFPTQKDSCRIHWKLNESRQIKVLVLDSNFYCSSTPQKWWSVIFCVNVSTSLKDSSIKFDCPQFSINRPIYLHLKLNDHSGLMVFPTWIQFQIIIALFNWYWITLLEIYEAIYIVLLFIVYKDYVILCIDEWCKLLGFLLYIFSSRKLFRCPLFNPKTLIHLSHSSYILRGLYSRLFSKLIPTCEMLNNRRG